MDTRTGEIFDEEEMKKREEKYRTKAANLYQPAGPFRWMKIPPTQKQMERTPPRVGRNEPCPCGSGKKFKKCCLLSEDTPHA